MNASARPRIGGSMERFIDRHSHGEFDVLVVGGGIAGAAVAYDAASRGLAVALVEKQDFGCATSAATSKLIHGGSRYLANYEFGLVRESFRERKTLTNIAPNFVYPQPVMVAFYDDRADPGRRGDRTSRGHGRPRSGLGRRAQGAGDFTGQNGAQRAAMTGQGDGR